MNTINLVCLSRVGSVRYEGGPNGFSASDWIPWCRSALQCARQCCALRRPWLRRLSYCVFQVPVNVLASLPVFIHVLLHDHRQIGTFFCPEVDTDYREVNYMLPHCY